MYSVINFSKNRFVSAINEQKDCKEDIWIACVLHSTEYIVREAAVGNKINYWP